MNYEPRKVFVIENNKYIELSYQSFCDLQASEESFKNKYFLQLHGMLMEVSKEVYFDHYRSKRRQKYLDEQSVKNGDISYDMLTAKGFTGENILMSQEENVQDLVERKIMVEKLCTCIPFLKADEKELIEALFFKGLSEREWSSKTGIPQKTVNDRKHRILAKLKKLLER